MKIQALSTSPPSSQNLLQRPCETQSLHDIGVAEHQDHTMTENETTRDRPKSWIEPPPEPLKQPTYIHEPKHEHHTSMIILHGRGDTGPSFGTLLVDESKSSEHASGDQDLTLEISLPAALPNTRFIFPSASRRPSTRFKGWKLNQWFDYWSLFDVSEKPELQNEGLTENAGIIEGLIEEEARKVGIENVILGGLSNGAAMAMITVLLMIGHGRLHQERRLGGLFALCGWLPYAHEMKRRAEGAEAGKHDQIATDDGREAQSCNEVYSWLCTLLEGPHGTEMAELEQAASARTFQGHSNGLLRSLFLAHGKDDNVVPIERFDDASSTMAALGCEVISKTYDGLGHWYSDQMLADLVAWTQTQSGCQ